jgi:hypothetical protein
VPDRSLERSGLGDLERTRDDLGDFVESLLQLRHVLPYSSA